MRHERHFYTGMDDKVVEVPQESAEVAIETDEIFTEGLGPCIGVAFSWRGQGYMFHGAGVHHTNEFDAFLDRASDCLAAFERSRIRPVVAGADVTGGVGNDVLRSRSYCLQKLGTMGFGATHEIWCPDGHSQSLYLDVRHNKVRVHTEPNDMDTGSEPTSIDIECSPRSDSDGDDAGVAS